MTIRAAAAAAVLLCAAASPAAGQADGPSYDQLTRCAAFNLVMERLAAIGPDGMPRQNQTPAENFGHQSAALLVIAAMTGEKMPQAVQADVLAQADALIQVLRAGDAGEADLRTDLESCTALGQAALSALSPRPARR